MLYSEEMKSHLAVLREGEVVCLLKTSAPKLEEAVRQLILKDIQEIGIQEMDKQSYVTSIHETMSIHEMVAMHQEFVYEYNVIGSYQFQWIEEDRPADILSYI